MSGIITNSYTAFGGKSGLIGPIPSFRAYTTGSATAFASGSQVVAVFGATNHNVGGHFNTSTNKFTAPVDGSYFMSSRILFDTSTTLHRMILYMHKDNSVGGNEFASAQGLHGGANHCGIGTSTVMYMSAGETSWVSVYSDGEAGSIYVDSNWSYFSGHLLG